MAAKTSPEPGSFGSFGQIEESYALAARAARGARWAAINTGRANRIHKAAVKTHVLRLDCAPEFFVIGWFEIHFVVVVPGSMLCPPVSRDL